MFFPFTSPFLSILTVSTESNYSSTADRSQFYYPDPPASPSSQGFLLGMLTTDSSYRQKIPNLRRLVHPSPPPNKYYIRTFELDGKRIKLQNWDAAGHDS
ncbi:unnamed protein product [Microthlaspi erraticum]|uniref:Uncharacterized protein n=1 Tax=Microthlaspi erraticum TaxID=1685480 RepID=A0A6D2HBZ1_9BRAS|nr:unnamed protein product [Microthlaspi erraticum]